PPLRRLAVRDGEVRVAPPSEPARPPCAAPAKDLGPRAAAHREAEGALRLRADGEAVPRLLRLRGETSGRDRRPADAGARGAAGQRGLPARLREHAGAGAAARDPRA